MAVLVRTQWSRAGREPADCYPPVPATLPVPLPAAEIQAIKDHVGQTGASATLQKQERHWTGFSR